MGNVQSSTRNFLLGPVKFTARRTISARVANRRHKTAATTNTGFSEYGFTKFEWTPGGGARAGTLEGSVVATMMLLLGTVDDAIGSLAQLELHF